MTFRLLIDNSNATPDTVFVEKKNQSSRGGARKGAGGKRLVQDPKRIAVDFEGSDTNALQELAQERGTSIATLVRTAVSQFLNRNKRK